MLDLTWEAPGLKLYRGDLSGEAEPWAECLSPDEIDRANRYGDPVLRRRFVIRRGMLRHLIGRDAEIQYGPLGKPSVLGQEFSLSSTGDLVVFLLSRMGPVGVDVERIDPAFDYQGILKASSPEEFFLAWTRREALGKAAGTGITEEPPKEYRAFNLSSIDGVALALATPIVP